jgi:mono/diheme cytochrome c family protein
VMLGGCNDCHTPGFAQSGGTTPETEWLTGDTVGWRGPWGTTYPTNLRRFIHNISEDAWVQFAHTVNARPPMPSWALHGMTTQDLRAMYEFIRSLGPKGVAAPPALPPDQEPKTPYILFVPQAPK